MLRRATVSWSEVLPIRRLWFEYVFFFVLFFLLTRRLNIFCTQTGNTNPTDKTQNDGSSRKDHVCPISTDSRNVVTSSTDRTVKVLGYQYRKMYRYTSCPLRVRCRSSDGRKHHCDESQKIRDFDSGTFALERCSRKLKTYTVLVSCIQISPSGSGASRLMTHHGQQCAALIDGRTFMRISTFRDLKFRTGSVNSKVCFSPKAGYIAAGGSTGSVFVWDTHDSEKAPQQLDGAGGLCYRMFMGFSYFRNR